MRTHIALLILAGLLAVTCPVFAADPEPEVEAEAAAESDDPVADDAPPADDDAIETAVEDRVSIDEIRRFVSVFRAVKQAYVEPIDDERLMRAAIRGLLSDLDPHSAYLDASQSQDLNEMATGAYDGLGIEVVQNPDRTLTVIAPIDDTPAARAGIRPGDVIIEIDGATITADNVDAAVESMRGAPGTKIRLKIQRDGAAEPLDFELVRETIRVASAKGRQLEPGFGYLRVSTFQQDTGKEAASQIAKLTADGALQGLVLDLRSNPGGLLHAAVALADLFLEEGEVVATRGRLPYANSSQNAQRGDVLKGAPIVVLIDAGTASAAEVVTAALQDRKRALVMGSRSFGKGSVQTILPIDNGDSLKLTTSRYYGPSGRSIQATGIVPDIVLPERVEWREARVLGTVREQDLPGHLEAEEADASAASADASGSAPSDEDFAVREAVNLLKGLALYGRKAG